MLYGAMNFPVKPILEELEAISELGFDYLELTMDPPQAHYSIIRQQKKRLLKALLEPEDFADIFVKFPNLKMTLDTGHAHIEDTGGGKSNKIYRKVSGLN